MTCSVFHHVDMDLSICIIPSQYHLFFTAVILMIISIMMNDHQCIAVDFSCSCHDLRPALICFRTVLLLGSFIQRPSQHIYTNILPIYSPCTRRSHNWFALATLVDLRRTGVHRITGTRKPVLHQHVPWFLNICCWTTISSQYWNKLDLRFLIVFI